MYWTSHKSKQIEWDGMVLSTTPTLVFGRYLISV